MGGHHGGYRWAQPQARPHTGQHRTVDAAARRLCRRQDQLHANSARGGFLVNWKTDLKLADLDAATAIEVVCKRCGLARYETQAKLIAVPGFRNFYLDEVEYSLCCSDRFCRGGVRISLTHDDRNEGFVGGMA